VLRYWEAVNTKSLIRSDPQRKVGVSAGTAAVIGLQRIRQTDSPTTAYLMVGGRCENDCAFCAQARSSKARAHFLSRVVWPSYPAEQTIEAIAHSFVQGDIERCCLQVTRFPGHLRETLRLVQQLRSATCIPVCVSIALSSLEDIRSLLQHGVERVTLALDAACDRVYAETKGRDWQRRLDLLRCAAWLFPGRIGTHLIAGLGETEREMSAILQEMVDHQITVGLFSFTPVPGTAWGNRRPPGLSAYRRIQAARFLLTTEACRVVDFSFFGGGQIASYGMSPRRLHNLLSDGQAFQTAGCSGCNRPYYNERPGKVMYNYPRPLNAGEREAAISAVMAELASGQASRRSG
jgi:biotin synthase-related radical SAM superfamily protein